MPPKPKYTREQILECAYELVRAEGIDSLSARNLAAKLGTSTAPIFTAFKGIDELIANVRSKAYELYTKYIDKGLEMTPPFKGTGLMYIKFAKDEPNFFKMLFMGANESPLTH